MYFTLKSISMVSSSFKMSLRIENWTDFCCDFRWFEILCFMRGLVFFFSFQFAFGCHVKWQTFFLLLFSSCFCFSTFDRQETRGIEYWIHKKKAEKKKKTNKNPCKVFVESNRKLSDSSSTMEGHGTEMSAKEREKEKIFNLSKLIMMSG